MKSADECYAQALTELREKTLHEATFAKAFADGLGDAEKTKALYVKYRATSLIKALADDEYRQREFQKMTTEARVSPITAAGPEDIAVPHANKTTAAILAILFGWLGAHKIYMGKFWPAMAMGGMFFIGLLTFAGLLSIAVIILSIYESVCYFNMSEEEFHRKYIVGEKSWF